MEWFTMLLGSLGSGGLTGIVGGALTLWKSYADNKITLEKMKMKNLQELALLDAEHKNMMLEIEANLNIKRVEGEVRMKESDDILFAQGLQYARSEIGNPEKEGIVLRFVEGMRRFFRPFVSYYSIIVLTIMSFWVYSLWDKMSLVLTQIQAYELTVLMLQTMIYMSTTVVFWWFTTRVPRPTINLGEDKKA